MTLSLQDAVEIRARALLGRRRIRRGGEPRHGRGASPQGARRRGGYAVWLEVRDMLWR